MMNENQTAYSRPSDALVAFGLGVIAGAVASLLLAPATGAETRRRINEFAQQMGQKAKEGAHKATDYVTHAKNRVGQAVDAGREAYERERSQV